MKLLVALFVVLFAVSCVADNNSTLQAIAKNIKTYKTINATTVGSVYANLQTALHLITIPLGPFNVSVNYDPLELVVNGNTVIWGEAVQTLFVIYFDNNDNIEIALDFEFTGQFDKVYKQIMNKTAPAQFNGLNATTQMIFELNSGSSGYPSIPQGVTLSADAVISPASPLLGAFKVFQPAATSVKVSASLFLPLFSANPEDFTFDLTEVGTIAINKNLNLNDFTVTACLGCATPVTISGAFTLLNIATTPLTITLSGVYNEVADTITLSGTMTGTLTHPLNLAWLDTVTSISGQLVVSLASGVQSINLQGVGTVSLAPSDSVKFLFSASGPYLEDIIIQVTNIPITTSDVAAVWTQLSPGQMPKILAQVGISGVGTITVADYSTGQIKEGLTFSVTASIADSAGDLMSATKVLAPKATTTTFQYVLELFIPIFDFTLEGTYFTLTETASFPINSDVLCKGYELEVSFPGGGLPSIDITSDLVVGLGSSKPVFACSAVFSSGSESASFTGTMITPEPDAFGLKWLTLNTAQISMIIGRETTTSVTISAGASVSFTKDPIKTQISFQGDTLSNWAFVLQAVPVTSATALYTAVVGSAAPKELEGMVVSAAGGTIAVANYPSQYTNTGMTLTANIQLTPGSSTVYSTSRILTQSPQTQDYTITLYVPIFGPVVEDISFTVSESGIIMLTSSLLCDAFTINIAISNSMPVINLSGNFLLTIPHNPAPLSISATANINGDTSAAFAGSVQGNWVDPFGYKWLTIDSLNVNLDVTAPGIVTSLELAGSGAFTFGTKESGTASLTFGFSNDFTDITLAASFTNNWNPVEIATSILGVAPPALLSDLQFPDGASIHFSISTCSCFGVMEGITLGVSAHFTGKLLTEVQKRTFFYKAPVSGSFDIQLVLPVFSTDPVDISFSFTLADTIPLTKTLTMNDIAMSFSLMPLAASLSTTVVGKFRNNPTLTFGFEGEFSTDGTFLVEGDMMGTWDNAFGLKGFELSNVIGEFGLSAAMCAVDACISDFGVGAGFQMGDFALSFDGNIAAPDFYDIFLAGSVTAPLPVLEIIHEWNKINPKYPIPTNVINPDWGMIGASFYLAPVDGKFGPIQYTAGFGVSGTIEILDMMLSASVNCSADTDTCNFGFFVNMSLTDFKNMIDKELGLHDESLNVFSLNSVSLSEWSQQNVATGVNPRWLIDITVWDVPHHLDFRVEQFELASSFHDFFNQWLASLFD